MPKSWRIISILIIGLFSVSSAAILIRLCLESAGQSNLGFSLFLAATRLGLASLILLPTWQKITLAKVNKNACYYALAAGICLALHFATWINSLSYTSIVASTTLVTTNPIWIALISWWWWKEKPSLFTFLGIFVAFIGSIVVSIGNNSPNSSFSNPLLGNFLALMSAIIVSLYMLLGKEAQERGLSIGIYATIVYTIAALILLPLPLFLGTTYLGYPSKVYVYLLLMAIFPQLIGHTCFNWAVTQISPTKVSLTILFEPIVSSLLAVWIFAEIPSLWVFLGGLLIILGVALTAAKSNEKKITASNNS